MSNSNRDINAELRKAVLKGNIEKVKRLISEGADVNAVDEHNNTLLHYAAGNGYAEIVKDLLDNGANVNAVGFANMTPLHRAAEEGRKEVVEVLLNNRANVNAIDEHNSTPLHRAAAHGHKEVVEALLQVEGIDVNAQNKYNDTPLHYAATNGYAEIVKDLLDNGADVNAVGQDEKTPLHWAAAHGRKDAVDALLKVKGIDVNAQDKDGKTPLHEAAKVGHAEIVKNLLKADGINVNAVDENRNTPLHLAAANGHKEIVKDLLDKGANVNAQNDTGETPLDLAGDDGIKTLLKNAGKSDDVDPVDKLSTSSEGVQEEDAAVNPEHPAPVEPNTPRQNNGGQINTTSAGEETQTSTNSTVSIKEEGKNYDKSEYFSGSKILDHDYQDKLTNIFINSHCSLNGGERMQLAENIHQIRQIFSKYTDNNIDSVWIGVFDIGKLDADEFKKRGIQENHWKNSIHVKFGDVQDKVLVYSWLDIGQFSQDKWNNLLSQLEGDHEVNFIGTGPLTFKYKDFNYRVYPPLFGSSDDQKSFLNNTEVFSFSPTEISQIIEDIKESHQSIEKKIIDHYQSLGKDFVKNGRGYIHIKADIGENNVKNFTDVSYTNRSDGIHNNPIEEAFVKDDVGGNGLHLWICRNNEGMVKLLLDSYNNDRINEVNKNGKTPLHLAAKYGREAMVKMLLNKEAKVDVVDSRGRTPLHWAAQNNNKEIVDALIKAKANVNIKDEDGKTPFDLATDEEIKTLLQNAEKPDDVNPVDESSTDSEGGQEEEKRVGDDTELQSDNSKEGEKTSTTSAEQGTGVSNGSQPTGSTQNKGGQTSTTSAGQGTDVQDNGVNHVASTEPAQTEEQPSSFFGSLFSILMKPFSLIASFFGGFFSWLFCSDTDESTSQTDADVSLLKLNSSDEKKTDAQPGNHSSLASNQSAGQVDTLQLGADDNQLLG